MVLIYRKRKLQLCLKFWHIIVAYQINSLLFGIGLVCLPNLMVAQKQFQSQGDMEQALVTAKQYMLAKEGDKSFLITEPLMAHLKATGQFDSSFGFQVRLIHGIALIDSSKKIASYEFLWHLRDESKKHEQWSVFANACREIARILEYGEKAEEAHENLHAAQVAIQKYQLDSVYASFAVRFSSWHRVFGSLDSARFYAQEAIRVAPKFGQDFEEAEGNLLMGIIARETDIDQSIFHIKRATTLYKKVGVYATFTSMQGNLARLYLLKNQPEAVIHHADTALYYAAKFLDNDPYMMYRPYQFKGEAYELLGQKDSTIFYLKKGFETELASVKREKFDLMVEVDKKYNIEKKTEELAIKAREVKAERSKNRQLFAMLFLFILLLGGLIYAYFKLRKVNALTQQQAEQLKALDSAKSRFFANISHELRTPISLILGPLETLLQENKLSPKQSQLLGIASQGSKNLKSLVDKILDLGKMEAGKMELNLQPIALTPFFHHYLTQFESLAAVKKVTYHYEVIANSKDAIMIDREKCRQIIYNLLTNAFKFTPAGGSVEVLVKLEKEQLQIQVIDTGKGIHAQDVPFGFNRYFQTNRKEATAIGGTGIGLAICQEYSKLFKGTITVDSKIGKGTTFLVQFPVALINIESAAYEDLTTHLAHNFNEVKEEHDHLSTSLLDTESRLEKTAKPSILLVEDNTDLQRYIQLILEEEYQVIVAENGKVALERLATYQKNNGKITKTIDLIISDLMMPVMDGYQLLTELKTSDKTEQIPTIMLTARAGRDDRLQALRLGVDDYLVKPFDQEVLKIRIKNLLSNQKIRQEVSTELIPEIVINNDSETERTLVEDMEVYIRKNMGNTSLNVTQFAKAFAMSESKMLRFLKRLTGLSTQKYIMEIRLSEARKLLDSGQYESITRLAIELGYKDVRTFSRSFKARYGKLPSFFVSN